MSIQKKGKQIKKLKKLIVEMGHLIRTLDEAGNYCEYWTMDGNENGPEYVPELERINEEFEKNGNSSEIDNRDDKIRVILSIEDGNIKFLHATTDLQYVVLNIDEDGEEPIIIETIKNPGIVDPELSLQMVNIDLEGVEGYDKHPWK